MMSDKVKFMLEAIIINTIQEARNQHTSILKALVEVLNPLLHPSRVANKAREMRAEKYDRKT